MTSDTKIGLLLGLVFIFVIAFLINGLPSLKASANSNQLTYNMVNHQADTPGLANTERQASHYMASLAPPPASAQLTAAPETFLPPLGDPQAEVRFRMPLPTHDPEVARSAADVLRQSQPPVNEPRQVQAQAQIYEVKPGDNLSKIAHKFYGAVLGNKLTTIDTLYSTNKAVLPSQDEVRAGVKLTIPIITGAATQVVQTTRPPAAPKQAKPNIPTMAVYTVKDGDSLWEIAADKLGNGSRFKEIAKLNQDLLQGGVKVLPGMQLKLPAR